MKADTIAVEAGGRYGMVWKFYFEIWNDKRKPKQTSGLGRLAAASIVKFWIVSHRFHLKMRWQPAVEDSVSVSCLDDAAWSLPRDGQMTRVIMLILSTLSAQTLYPRHCCPQPHYRPHRDQVVPSLPCLIFPASAALMPPSLASCLGIQETLETEKCVLWAD